MSISIVLVPLAVAAVTAAQDRLERRREAGRLTCQVETRMKDGGLLSAALADTGAVVRTVTADVLEASWGTATARFDRDADGIWTAHFDGAVDEAAVRSRVAEIDRAYGRQVQAAVVARLRERAPVAGFVLDSQRIEDDESVTLVLRKEA